MLDQGTGSSGQQFRGAVGALFYLCIERANGRFVQTIEQSVITH